MSLNHPICHCLGQPAPHGNAACRTKISRYLSQFRDDDGAITVLTLFFFLFMFAMGGIAVDVMHQENRRAQLQQTLDGAVLASANLRQTQDPQVVVQDYFTKTGLVQYLDPMDATDYTVKTNERRVEASAGIDVPTYFMKFSGITSLSAVTLAAAEQSQVAGAPGDREVSIVLDISGSMRNEDRVEEMQTAAKDLVTTLLTGDAANTTSINVVPFSGHVNPGEEMFEILGGIEYGTTGEDLFPESVKDISNVVLYYDNLPLDGEPYDYAAKIEDYPGNDVPLFNKDDLDEYIFFLDAFMRRQDIGLPDSATLVGMSYKAGKTEYGPYLMDGTIGTFPTMNLGTGTQSVDYSFGAFYAEVIPQYSSCIDFGSDDFTHTGLPDDGTYDQVGHFNYWPTNAEALDWGWCPEDDTAIQYAQNDEAALHAFIDGLRLHDGTGTHIGMKYGLALLDPTSQDEFSTLSSVGLVPSGFADRPKAWSDTGTKKYIVLMSEGGIQGQPRPVHKLDPINEATALTSQASSETTFASSTSQNVQDFKAICDLAKANDVEIYAIAFEADSAGQAEMQYCASSASHYFEADSDDLSGIFGAVGKQITQLRLTK